MYNPPTRLLQDPWQSQQGVLYYPTTDIQELIQTIQDKIGHPWTADITFDPSKFAFRIKTNRPSLRALFGDELVNSRRATFDILPTYRGEAIGVSTTFRLLELCRSAPRAALKILRDYTSNSDHNKILCYSTTFNGYLDSIEFGKSRSEHTISILMLFKDLDSIRRALIHGIILP